MKNLQFVWCWNSWEFGFVRPTNSIRFIYRWILMLGPLEVLRWEPRTVTEIRATDKETP